MKNRCQNGTQKIMKWTKNATKINEKVEGRRGKGRKGKGKERKREDRRGEGRKGEERKPTGRGDGAPAGQRQLGGSLINLKGGDPLAPAGESFCGSGILRTSFFRCQFSHRFLMSFWRPPDPQKLQKWTPKRAKILPGTDPKMKRKLSREITRKS